MIVESAAMEVALASRSIPGATGAEVWRGRLDRWRERGVLERTYSRRPRKTVTKRKRRALTDLQRAKSMPPRVESGEELVRLGENVWQDRAMLSKAVDVGRRDVIRCRETGAVFTDRLGATVQGTRPHLASHLSLRPSILSTLHVVCLRRAFLRCCR